MIAPLLAMHMANELLSIPVAAGTLVIGFAAVALAATLSRRRLDSEKLPLMGVLGAFVFAAQMINFTLPGLGTSGHLGGAVLLAILLGPAAAIVTMAAILIIQCLLFADGGLLALGCNIINMAVIPSIVGWAIYRLIAGSAATTGPVRQYLAAWLACVAGVTAGAAMVPLQTAFSGVLTIPAGDFLAVMVGIHLLIGLVEGLITFAVLAYLRRTRPAAVGLGAPAAAAPLSRRALGASIVVTSLLIAGVVSWFASSHPDGLEWSYGVYPQQAHGQASGVGNSDSRILAASTWQQRWSPMSDYTARSAPMGEVPSGQGLTDDESAEPAGASLANVDGWGSLAGVIGTLATVAVLFVAARLIARRQRASSLR